MPRTSSPQRLFPHSTLLPPLQRGHNSTAADVTALEGPLRRKHANQRISVKLVVPEKVVTTWLYLGQAILIDLRPILEEEQAVETEKCVVRSNLLALGHRGVRGGLAMATVIM